jgi:hypothetical protein
VSNPYKTLQGILEKIKEHSETARYSKDPQAVIRAIMESQERLAEAFLVVGAILQVIVDKQLTVNIEAPEKKDRS